MKRILLLMTLLLLSLTGCSNIKAKDKYKNGITLTSMDQIPAVTDLIELK